MTEARSFGGKAVGFNFETIHDPTIPAPTKEGIQITFATLPPTVIQIFPNRVNAQNEHTSVELRGETTFSLAREGLIFTTVNKEKTSHVLVRRDGGLSFSYQTPTDAPKEQQIPYPIRKKDRELFANVTIDDPSTFEPLTFGQTVKYLRRDAKLTQEDFAERLGKHPTAVMRLEAGTTSTNKNRFLQIHHAFGWEKDDPRHAILEQAYERELDP